MSQWFTEELTSHLSSLKLNRKTLLKRLMRQFHRFHKKTTLFIARQDAQLQVHLCKEEERLLTIKSSGKQAKTFENCLQWRNHNDKHTKWTKQAPKISFSVLHQSSGNEYNNMTCQNTKTQYKRDLKEDFALSLTLWHEKDDNSLNLCNFFSLNKFSYLLLYFEKHLIVQISCELWCFRK